MPSQNRNGFMDQAFELGSESVFNIGLHLFVTHRHRFPHCLCLACRNPSCCSNSYPHLMLNACECRDFDRSELTPAEQAQYAENEWEKHTYINDDGDTETVEFINKGLYEFPQQHRY